MLRYSFFVVKEAPPEIRAFEAMGLMTKLRVMVTVRHHIRSFSGQIVCKILLVYGALLKLLVLVELQ